MSYSAVLAALEAQDETAITAACRALVAEVVTMAEAVRQAYDALPPPTPAPDPEVLSLTTAIQEMQAAKDALHAEIGGMEDEIAQLQRAIQSVEAENLRLATAG